LTCRIIRYQSKKNPPHIHTHTSKAWEISRATANYNTPSYQSTIYNDHSKTTT